MKKRIIRDHFGSASLMRKKTRGSCQWCDLAAKFQYGWEYDIAPGKIEWSHPFCSWACYLAYSLR